MRRREFTRRLAASLLLGAGCGGPARVSEPAGPQRVLLLTQTAGSRLASIPVAAATVARLRAEGGAWELLALPATLVRASPCRRKHSTRIAPCCWAFTPGIPTSESSVKSETLPKCFRARSG